MASDEVRAWLEAEGEFMVVDPDSPFLARKD